MKKEKTYIDKYPICDICGKEVGELQRGSNWRNEKRHFCFSCWWVGLAIRDLEHGKGSMKDEYLAEGKYKFDFDELINFLIIQARRYIKKLND